MNKSDIDIFKSIDKTCNIINSTNRINYTCNFRVNVNYYSIDYDNKCLETSTAYKNLEEAYTAFEAAKLEKCVDDPNKPAKVDLTAHIWDIDENGNAKGQARQFWIMSNYKH